MGKFDWHADEITRKTPVTPEFRFSQNVRRFLIAECGEGFKSTRPFMAWIRDRQKKTMGDVADEWNRQQGRF